MDRRRTMDGRRTDGRTKKIWTKNFSTENFFVQKLFVRKNFRSKKFLVEIFFGFFFGFSLFSVDFRGARVFLTSKSNSSRSFALDGQIFRSVRPLGLIFRFFTARTSSCGGKARVTEIPGGRSPPDPSWGQGTGNGDSWGGKPPQTPPRHHFKKFALQGQIF